MVQSLSVYHVAFQHQSITRIISDLPHLIRLHIFINFWKSSPEAGTEFHSVWKTLTKRWHHLQAAIFFVFVPHQKQFISF
jgi:hypothetical protein